MVEYAWHEYREVQQPTAELRRSPGGERATAPRAGAGAEREGTTAARDRAIAEGESAAGTTSGGVAERPGRVASRVGSRAAMAKAASGAVLPRGAKSGAEAAGA